MNIPKILLEKDKRLVAGHRGMMARYPENTLLSFEKALALGVDMLEMDINITKDGIPVVIHDRSVDRTTNGKGAVRELNLKEIKALDAGVKFDAQFKGLKVPTFEEFCQLMGNHRDVLLNVEIKDNTKECVDLTVGTLTRHSLVENCVFTCFDAVIVEHIHRDLSLPTQGFPDKRMANFKPGKDGTRSRLTAVGIEMGLLTPELVRDYENQGILPWAYCPDDEESALLALNCGARLVTCNNPEPAMKVFRAV